MSTRAAGGPTRRARYPFPMRPAPAHRGLVVLRRLRIPAILTLAVPALASGAGAGGPAEGAPMHRVFVRDVSIGRTFPALDAILRAWTEFISTASR